MLRLKSALRWIFTSDFVPFVEFALVLCPGLLVLVVGGIELVYRLWRSLPAH